jgi:uncharacterized protein YndB with AHSA1/START domain
MDSVQFTYTTYIAAPPEKLWKAIFDAKMTAKYWQHENVSDWRPGSRWEHRSSDKKKNVDLVGKVVKCLPQKRLVLTWAFPDDEGNEKKHSTVVFEIKPFRGVSRLTVTHDRLEPGSDMLEGITDGWPKVISSLKSLLETGRPLPKLW